MKMLTHESAAEAAAELGIVRDDPIQMFSRKFRLYQQGKPGGWPAIKDGRYWCFDVAEIKKFIGGEEAALAVANDIEPLLRKIVREELRSVIGDVAAALSQLTKAK